ncbi:PAS domain S-box protein [Terrihabitans rhizophilus]|uniref:histidine kinase n=1 Tax=Terrihabitans rhizophilus TaxID=3092662 RepID=A0ABU4RL34_9HYPH|nr:PAS domain S-box protein [Terrihabitans sp. PJ23]MDX6804445.1 PAS domain S-box protein [Terrihabitans sp. PJ23]
MTSQDGGLPHAVEDRYRLLLDSVTDYAIYMLDPTGIVSSWNAGAERFKGYTADEIVGRHFSAFYTPEDRERGEPERALATAASEGKFEIEAWRIRKDGTRFWASVVIDPIWDKKKRLIGFAKITRDNTERMLAQRALKQSEERFRILVQGVADYAIYMLDAEGHVTNWNLGAQRIKGYGADEIVGHHFSRFYAEEDLANQLPARALETARRTGKFESEGWRIRKDGSRFWASVVIDAIHDEAGALIGFAKITRDMTERREAAEALEKARQALFQAQKMEAIGQLTGGIAHDFNNLLTVMISSLDILRSRLHEPREARLLDNALLAAERGSQLTGQLLAFARRQSLKPQVHDLNQVIETFEAILRRAAGGEAAVKIVLSHEMRTVLIDSAQFEAALLNLVVNARDACGADGSIEISTEVVTFHEAERLLFSTAAAGDYVKVSVTDNGPGMSEDVLSHACEPFFTTKEVGKGTGLGLSQVYGFAGQSDGHLHIVTAPGQGASVSLYLPAKEPVARGDRHEHGAASTVLIVDDDEQVLEAAVEMFDSLGYEVLTASHGPAAIDILRRDRRIDVLFSDVVMPRGMTGFELADAARKLRPELKILLASGYPVPAFEKSGGGRSDTAFISKPYRWSDVLERLRNL